MGLNFGSLSESKHMSARTALQPRLYFSYRQFLVYDLSVRNPGCIWTDIHIAQGFARRGPVVSFGTLLEFGYADVSYCRGPFQPNEAYARVIAVPFVASTGKVMVDGPEEINVGRAFDLPVGSYQLVAAQYIVSDEEEVIDLFFENFEKPLGKSNVVVADGQLNPPACLIETAEVA
jgi:hypothetical protein